jgi:acetolactate synthase-1/2/3 large subunit
MVMIVETPSVALDTAIIRRYFPGALRARHHGHARYGQLLSGGELAAEFLQFVGAGVIFGIPGGASLPLNDAFTAAHHAGAVRYLLTGHEQGAGFEAEGFAAASGRCGFCTATSGPGATNLVTPLADATRDSRPLMALTGNTATTAEPEAFQAIDIVGITHGIATKLSSRAERPEDVQELLVAAYHAAVTGRPGAVLVDFPKDVQVKQTVIRPWEDLLVRFDWSLPCAAESDIDALARLLAGARRPVLYVGHGAILSGAADLVRALSERHAIPVATTVHALGTLPADDSRNLGMIGMHGTMVANLAPYLADVVVALGARFDDRVVGAKPEAFAPHAQIVHVDVDAYQLNRVRRVDLAIHGDVADTLARVLRRLAVLPGEDRAPWLAELAALRHALPLQSYDDPGQETLSHEWVYGETARLVADLAAGPLVATLDVGIHQMKGAQWLPASSPRSLLTSGGMGSMGCALPMAVGAHFARPEATVLAFCGDGGMVMASHELDTLGGHGLPVKLVVFDDSSLGMVGNWHGLYFGGRRLTSDRRRGRARGDVDLAALKASLGAAVDAAESADDLAAALALATAELAVAEWPLFAATAAGYGIPAERVHTKAAYTSVLQRALQTPGPYLVQVMLPAVHGVFPLMEPGSTPQDIVWRETAPGSGARVPAAEHFDYAAKCLRASDNEEHAAQAADLTAM